MNAQEIILQVQEEAAEWLEMSNNPSAFVAGVLANKIIKLNEHIEYLERRLRHDSNTIVRDGTRDA